MNVVLLPADTTAPVITVTGNDPETVIQDAAYADAGATATDDTDETVTVTPTGGVDTSTVGTYTITYTATDAAGNTATETRTVNVVSDTGTIYEDAEDGETSGWFVYDDDPAGATISNVYNEDKQSRVIRLSGDGINNGYILGGAWGSFGEVWDNTQEKTLKWSMNFSESFYIYVDVETDAGHRYMIYVPADNDSSWGAEYPVFGLGSSANNGQWHVFTRDLQVDLAKAEPGVTILEVNAFLIRGSGLVDDIELISDGEVADTIVPVITLNGSNPMDITQGGNFTDPGATATDDTDETVTVTPTGGVDTSTVGTYTITYTATDAAGNTATETRTVNVVSNGQPTASTVYEDAEDGGTTGWEIYDNTPEGAYIWNVYDDVLNSQVIELGGWGLESGFRLRNEDGSKWYNRSQFVIQWSMQYSENFHISIDVETDGGQYFMTYRPHGYDMFTEEKDILYGLGSNAADGQWHSFTRDLQADLAKAHPNVIIQEVNGFSIRGSGKIDDIKLITPTVEEIDLSYPTVHYNCKSPGMVALTFDDGVTDNYDQLLDILDVENVPATFFIIGDTSNNDLDKERLIRAYTAGHQIANHSWSHPPFTELSDAEIEVELADTNSLIIDAIGYESTYMRPPYADFDLRVANTLIDIGYQIVIWNLETRDYDSSLTSDEMYAYYQNAFSTADPLVDSFISLQHDWSLDSISIVSDIISLGKSKGFTFVTIEECLQ